MTNSLRPRVRVLLIEDNDVDALFVTRMLDSNPELEFDIDHVTTLADAIGKLQTFDYDVTMLDLSLPDADGLESYDQIRALDARLPVVVLTGTDDENLAIIAIESGAQDFMAKGHITGRMLFRALRFAIARQRKVMGFKAVADTDPLTGMPNRRYLESQFSEFAAKAQKRNTPLSLALLDVDHFKKINDAHGHFMGDAVLKEVSTLLTQAMPKGMLAARFGGEEFVLLMPGCDLNQASELVQSILEQLATMTMTFDDLVIKVTASAGAVEIKDSTRWDEFYVKADVALYEAKSSGRNRLCRHDQTEMAPPR
ncbi:MAG: GGDEF domain-containing response regulator [Pirellulales bacterium]|nr:GGDEF domain-containing response regulator [Pirellulales bacterium]